jgi:predicted dehydrogenase
MTINAGHIPSNHWLQDKEVGGGRVIGEVCHFLDLMRFLVGEQVTQHSATMIGKSPTVKVQDDKVMIVLSFADGSVGVINYLANGGKAFPKERIEIFSNDSVLQLNNFKELKGYSWKGFKKFRTIRQNKGQKECVAAFVDSIVSGGMAPIPMRELMEVSRLTIEIAESLRK